MEHNLVTHTSRYKFKKLGEKRLEEALTHALISYVSSSKGKRVTIRARQLVRIAGIGVTHSNIVRAAQFLKKLALRKLITPQVRKRFTHSVTLNYVIDDTSELWRTIKDNPGKAYHIIITTIART